MGRIRGTIWVIGFLTYLLSSSDPSSKYTRNLGPHVIGSIVRLLQDRGTLKIPPNHRPSATAADLKSQQFEDVVLEL